SIFSLTSRAHFSDNLFYSFRAIRGLKDRSPDYYIVRSPRERTSKGSDTLLIVSGCKTSANSGSYDKKIVLRDCLLHRFDFMWRSYNAIETAIGSQTGKLDDLGFDVTL